MVKYRPHLFVLCVLAAIQLTGLHTALQNALTDVRFDWLRRQASGDIVLVAIDSPSIDKIGVWPWPRRLHAELIGKLESAGVSDVAFDVDFSSPSDQASDQAFVDALQKAGGSVILPSFRQWVGDRGNGKTIHVSRPLPQFGKHAWSATVNVAVEPDGLVRRYSLGDTLDGIFLPSMGALLAGKYERKEESFWIDFGIRADSVVTVSYVDVLHGDPTTVKKLKDKKVIIGGTALELGDHISVPNGRIISGALLQTLAAESIRQGRALHASSSVVTLSLLSVLVFLMLVLWRRHSGGVRVLVLVGLAAAAELSAMLLQANLPIILDTSLFHAAVIAYLTAIALDEIDFHGLLEGILENRFQRIAMSLGDGLVCTDRNGMITVWNPGAVVIFGYEPEEMIGRPLGKICTVDDGAGNCVPFSILDLPHEALQVSGGKVMELRGRRKNGEAFPLEACFSGWQGTDGFQYGAILRDISVRKREAERIRYLAEYDTLTGLANRSTLYGYLGAKLAEANTKPCEVALLLVDLDKFKEINDSLGHACGDQVLCAVAERLNALVGSNGLVARLSGDEFAIVISGADVPDRAERLSEQTSLAIRKIPFSVGARQFDVKGSIGVAIYPRDCGTADELLGNADLALYRAKATGRGRHVFFDRRIRDELEARLSLEVELGQAAEKDEFELFYQPQVSLRDGRLVGAEALIRWRHPDRSLLLPANFMPILNASLISDRVAFWVMETTCRQGRLWQQKGHNIRLSINLSPSQLKSGDLPVTVGNILKDTGFSPTLLELEVTEDILLADDERALEIFRRIQDLGVRVAFDDYGTGYASLAYLKKFPLDGLKIDQSFVRELRAGSNDAAIVSSTINLSKLLGLSVIAEGIEDRATVDLLLSMGCEHGQGHYFGYPMPAAEFERTFLSKDAPRTSGNSAAGSVATAA